MRISTAARQNVHRTFLRLLRCFSTTGSFGLINKTNKSPRADAQAHWASYVLCKMCHWLPNEVLNGTG